jgi:hypothetical protein
MIAKARWRRVPPAPRRRVPLHVALIRSSLVVTELAGWMLHPDSLELVAGEDGEPATPSAADVLTARR